MILATTTIYVMLMMLTVQGMELPLYVSAYSEKGLCERMANIAMAEKPSLKLVCKEDITD